MASQNSDAPESGGRSLGGALRDVWLDGSTLLQQHAGLASAELASRTAGLGVDAAGLIGGLVLLHVAAILLLVAAALALQTAGLAPWLATLIVAVATLAFGTALVLWGRGRLRHRTAGPSDTLMACKESGQWLTSLIRTHRA